MELMVPPIRLSVLLNVNLDVFWISLIGTSRRQAFISQEHVVS
jgi:hypothetical protein